MWLLLTHPEVATRDCEHCQQWQYDEETGKVVVRRGEELPRIGPTPCRTKTGCAKGTPEAPKSLTARNLIAYNHYLESRATGRFPDDAVARRNAALVRSVEDGIESSTRQKINMLIELCAMKI